MKIFVLALSLVFSVTLLNTANALVPENKDEYTKFLQLKKRTLQDNIKNIETSKFLPKDVVWFKNEGSKVVPRPNPYKQVFNPSDPKANESGMIYYPNVDKEKELAELKDVEQKLKQLEGSNKKTR